MRVIVLAITEFSARRDEGPLRQDPHLGHLGHVGHQLRIGAGAGQHSPPGLRVAHGPLEPLPARRAVLEAGAGGAPQHADGLVEGLLVGGDVGGDAGDGAAHDMLLGHGGCVQRPIGS